MKIYYLKIENICIYQKKAPVKSFTKMESQKQIQWAGEGLLLTFLKGVKHHSTLTFDDFDKPRQLSNIDSTYEDEPSPEETRSIIYDEIPAIFKLGNKPIDSARFIGTLARFFESTDSLGFSKYSTYNKKNVLAITKLMRTYNKSLNIILQHLRPDYIDNEGISERRDIISRMKLYKVGPYFIFDSCDRSIKINSHEPQNKQSIEMRFLNYDGMPRMNSESIVLRVSKTVNRKTQQPSQGVSFSFESKKDFLTMLISSIESATINQLYFQKDTNIFFGGCLIIDKNIFSLKLVLQHGLDLNAELDSTSMKIMHNLGNGSIDHKVMRSAFNTYAPFLGIYQMMDLYVRYHSIVTKKIYQLINSSFSIPGFPLICIECFRPECNHRNIFTRPAEGSYHEDFCEKCNIAEFCLLCGKSSHGGSCDTTPDEWISQNTKVCPGCNSCVEKDEGCNHMQCTICNTHFCWICNQKYDGDRVSEHYVDFDAFGRCNGV